MNIKAIVSRIRNLDKFTKISDKVLYSGTIVLGNLNDQINCINRVAPNLSTEVSDRIFQELSESGVEQGEKLNYKLTDNLDGDFVYKYELGKFYLVFYKQN